MKKAVVFLLTLCMVFALCGCGEKGPSEYEQVESALQGAYSFQWYATYIQRNCYVGYQFTSGAFEYVNNSAVIAQGRGVYTISTEDKTITCHFSYYLDDDGTRTKNDVVFTYELKDNGELVLKDSSNTYTKER